MNHIELADGEDPRTDIGKVLSLWAGGGSDVPEMEDARLSARFVLTDQQGQPIGRLHLKLEPGVRKVDSRPILLVTLMVRGSPTAPTIPSVLEFMDMGGVHIVRTFTSITTPEMHKLWGRTR